MVTGVQYPFCLVFVDHYIQLCLETARKLAPRQVMIQAALFFILFFVLDAKSDYKSAFFFLARKHEKIKVIVSKTFSLY